MKKELLNDAVGRLDADIIDGHFKFKEKLQKRRALRGVIVRACAAAALVAVVAVGAVSPEVRQTITSSTLFREVFNRGELTAHEVTTDADPTPEPWEKFNMSQYACGTLRSAKGTNKKVAMTVSIRDTEARDAFVYEGKSYADHVAERDALRRKNEQLENGIQTDEIKAQIGENKKEIVRISSIITEASRAFSSKCTDELFEIFTGKGFNVIRENGILHLYATYREISRLDIDISEKLFFDLGNEFLFTETNEIGENNTDDQTQERNEAARFWKIKIYGYYTSEIKDSEDLREVIEAMVEKWRSEYDHLEFRFGHAIDVDSGIFENMNYFGAIGHSSNIEGRSYLKVKYEDIDIKALEELLEREYIVFVHIGYPLVESYEYKYLGKFTKKVSGYTSSSAGLKTEQDLVALIESTAQKNDDEILLYFFGNEIIGEDVFKNINYTRALRDEVYPTCMKVFVKKGDINIDALAEIAQRDDIDEIMIASSNIDS